MAGNFIVKVQQSLAGTDGKQVLIYNHDRSVRRQFPASDTMGRFLLSLLGDRPKAYFTASLTGERLYVGAEVPNPGW